MPEFICRLGTPTGEITTRTIEADTSAELLKHFEQDGFRVFSIEQANRKTQFTFLSKSKAIKMEEFFLFNQQFATLLRAGLPMLQALGILIRRLKQGAFRTILEDVERRIRNGAALSDALSTHPKIFPRLYTASVLAGERSGELNKVLVRYTEYAKAMTELRRKLKKTLTYPVILITASIGLITLLTTFVIPKFATLYEGSGSDLPALTRYVVSISMFAQSNIIWLLPLIIILVVVFFFWKKSEEGKRVLALALLKLPLVKDIICQTTIARLSRSLATLLSGGLTLVESLEISSEVISNTVISEAMTQTIRQIREGKSFIDALEEANWVPSMALDMIGVGEKSGALGTMLDEVASFYDAELDVRLSSLTTIIEPVVLVIMASVVLTVLLALYLPILQFAAGK